MAQFKVTFALPNPPRVMGGGYQHQQYTIVTAFDQSAARRLVESQYPNAKVYGCATL